MVIIFAKSVLVHGYTVFTDIRELFVVWIDGSVFSRDFLLVMMQEEWLCPRCTGCMICAPPGGTPEGHSVFASMYRLHDYFMLG